METFHHQIQTDAKLLPEVVKVVLQTICFHRLFGTIRPATYEAFGMTFPMVKDAGIERLIQDKCQLVYQQRERSPSGQVELIVFFLHPSSSSSSSTGTPSEHSTSASSASSATATPGGVAAQAASSLRAWASPKSYPYSWLAQAFSGGAGQVGGGSAAPAPSPYQASGSSGVSSSSPSTVTAAVEEEIQSLEKQAFERWTITFSFPQESQDRLTRDASRTRELTSHSLASFLDKCLTFVEEKKQHIPAIISADLCPFPLRVLALPVP